MNNTQVLEEHVPDICTTHWVELLLAVYADCYFYNICNDWEMFKRMRNALNCTRFKKDATVGEVYDLLTYIGRNYKRLHNVNHKFYANKDNIKYIGEYAS